MRNPARKKTRPMLSAFVDGELGPKERLFVERHLAACKESADEVADMRAVSSLLRTSLEEAAQEEDWAAFGDRVAAQLLPERLPFLERLRIQLAEIFTYRKSWVLAGTSAVALVALSLFIWTSPEEAVGYGSPQLHIKAVSAKGALVKTIVTHTETGDAIVWVVEETPAEEGEATPAEEGEATPAEEGEATPAEEGVALPAEAGAALPGKEEAKAPAPLLHNTPQQAGAL